MTRNGKYDIHLVTMLRNEADILPAFFECAAALFDRIHVIDHQSTDGSRPIMEQYAAKYEQIEIFEFPYRAYYQSEISNCFARRAFREGASWVFFLDADEFLDIEDRPSLEHLARTLPHDVMHLRWNNLVPTDPGSFTDFDAGQEFHWDGRPSRYGKIAVSATFAANNPDFVVHQGKHTVSRTRSEAPAPVTSGCPILHVPIRSLDRMRYKAASGVKAYSAKKGRNPAEGFHWFEMYHRLERGALDADWMRGIAAHYGEPLQGIKPVKPEDREWTVKRIPGAVVPGPSRPVASLADTIVLDAQQEWKDVTAIDKALLRADVRGREILLRPQPIGSDAAPPRDGFAELPADERGGPATFGDSRIAEALSHAFRPIAAMIPGDWAAHAPFLFALFHLFRPRRYVEIGADRGTSFFAACQAAQQIDGGTQCVAVDTWIADEQDGRSREDVFEEFRSDIGRSGFRDFFYIRSHFEQALACFEDGSIDLLHIDGQPAYEAVKKIYESWSPKMSRRGVILFHDTNAYERGFGVWRLWNEIRERYPHFHFPHCHGLGVIYVGDQPSPIADLLRRLEQSDGLAVAAISIFSGLGPLSIDRAVLDRDLASARSENQALSGEIAGLREELARVNTELASAQSELASSRSENARMAEQILKSQATLIQLNTTQAALNAKSDELERLSAHFGRYRYKVTEQMADRLKPYPRICRFVRAAGRHALSMKRQLASLHPRSA